MLLIKTLLFRSFALLLLIFSVGFMVLPDSGTYSIDTTFIKSHFPSSDNYYLSIFSDDKEDRDEDGSVDIQVSACLFARAIEHVFFESDFQMLTTRPNQLAVSEVYILNKQLVI